MKEKIEKLLEQKIEELLQKETITNDEYKILYNKLKEIELEEEEMKKEKLIEMLLKLN